jgi:HAE1 family hydrophobic/amphiphilic exporter-1
MFYRQFSITMATAIVLSGIVALTLTPALCAIILKNNHGKERKKGILTRLIEGFNKRFDKSAEGYVKILEKIVNRRSLTFILLLLFCGGIFFISRTVPSGFIPGEDQAMIYAIIQTPPGSSLERTYDVSERLQKIAEGIDGIQSVSALAGYEILTEGTSSNTGTCLINLKEWSKRKLNAQQIIEELEKKSKDISGANIEFFQPPAVPGYGAAGGFELRLLDKAGTGNYKKLEQVNKDFVNELKKRKELTSVFSFYSASFPQYLLEVDNDIAQQKGVTIENAMNTLSTLVGSNYEISFIKFGKMYKVIVEAAPEYRALPEDILKLYVKNNRDQMVPFSDFIKMKKVYGLSEITRHNLYNSTEISGSAAPGYSSGEAIKIVQEVAEKTLPHGYGIDWAGISADEVAQGNQAIIVFLISLIFVYMVLAGQYESFILPLSVILCLPAGIFGTFLFLKLFGLENNIYAQIAMVMLIGLLGKNAVLIVEYAALRHSQGLTIFQATLEGAKVRFRPILMTSFAFIAGLLPLMFATGPGRIGNRTIGTAAAGGMLFGTVFGVFIIPGLYFVFGTIAEKYSFIKNEKDNPLTEELQNHE